jgi:hypothetical protein
MGGLFSSTLLTLIVLPCLYILVNRFLEKYLGYEEEVIEVTPEESFEENSEEDSTLPPLT